MARPRIDADAVLALIVMGASHRSIARSFGISHTSVDRIAKQRRDDLPRLPRKPQAPRRKPTIEPERPRFVRVPEEFRVADLTDDYRDLVRDFGDVEGERRCRRLLIETRRLEALDARLGRAA
ncbi:UNVERIFIED_CONTAM: hypothetical protein Q9R58_07685 [Methylobacteriaceae bacterium AG10]|nr:hypothetical protein [Methylobacteriaceae bacterium AG10]